MPLEFWIKCYLVFAVVTAMGIGKHRLKYFWRCVLLWPAFWLYIVALIASLAICDLRNKNS